MKDHNKRNKKRKIKSSISYQLSHHFVLLKKIRKEREEEMKRKQNLISKLSSQPTNTRETRKSKEIREKVRNLNKLILTFISNIYRGEGRGKWNKMRN